MITHIISIGIHVLYTFIKSRGPVANRIGNYFFSSFVESHSMKAVKAGIMSTKHLKKGDALPPFNGVMRVYNMRFCPYAQRSILALNAKNVPYEIVNVDLEQKPEWLFVKSPLGKVPSIEISDGVTIHESLITADFIDEKYPQRPLHSKDPLTKAKDRLLVERFNSFIRAFYHVLFRPEDASDESVQKYFDELDFIQTELKKRNSKFLFGDEPGMPDYMIWPWLERLDVVVEMVGARFKLDKERFAALNDYLENMKLDLAVKDYFLDSAFHIKYVQSKRAGRSDYDMTLLNKL